MVWNLETQDAWKDQTFSLEGMCKYFANQSIFDEVENPIGSSISSLWQMS